MLTTSEKVDEKLNAIIKDHPAFAFFASAAIILTLVFSLILVLETNSGAPREPAVVFIEQCDAVTVQFQPHGPLICFNPDTTADDVLLSRNFRCFMRQEGEDYPEVTCPPQLISTD